MLALRGRRGNEEEKRRNLQSYRVGPGLEQGVLKQNRKKALTLARSSKAPTPCPALVRSLAGGWGTWEVLESLDLSYHGVCSWTQPSHGVSAHHVGTQRL